MDADTATWLMLGPSAVYALTGLLLALCIMIAVLLLLVDSLRVDRFKLFSKRMLARLFE